MWTNTSTNIAMLLCFFQNYAAQAQLAILSFIVIMVSTTTTLTTLSSNKNCNLDHTHIQCGVCGVCGSDDSPHGVSVQACADYAPNWVAEHLGASSRRPRHPFPAQMAGEPLAVYLCTRPKKSTHQPTNSTCGAAHQGHRPPV